MNRAERRKTEQIKRSTRKALQRLAFTGAVSPEAIGAGWAHGLREVRTAAYAAMRIGAITRAQAERIVGHPVRAALVKRPVEKVAGPGRHAQFQKMWECKGPCLAHGRPTP